MEQTKRLTRWVGIGLVCLGQISCGSLAGNVALGTVGATLLGGHSPNNEIEQIYYLGVFDPQEQVPPTVYRVRVHGQASFISLTRFASGWVQADLIDSLGTGVGFNQKSGKIEFTKGDASQLDGLKPGRRLVLFGPEGFREAPKNHRLVIVMGSNPQAFFEAIDQSLGIISEVIEEQRLSALDRMLFEALARVRNERERLSDLDKDIASDLKP